MEIKTTYEPNYKDVIMDKMEYKQRHFHDYSVITTDIHFKEEYAKIMITESRQETRRKTTMATQVSLATMTNLKNQPAQYG
eukprot:3451310-Amphidinium_carterae.1